jgi:outer membrane protein TolC
VTTTRWQRKTAMVLLAALLSQGCAAPGRRLQYLIGDEKTLQHYEDYSTAIEYPVETEKSETNPALFEAPRSITSLDNFTARHIRLDECVRTALSNATILREDQNFGSPANPLMSNPSRVASVYDTAIQETAFLFGNRGTEAALSDFDPVFTNSMQWGRSEDPQNSPNLGIPSGGTLVDETAQFQARLEKSLANSGTVAVEHDWNYSQNNNTRLFPSAYTGFLQAEYRQPLLAGSGTEFTRIAGVQSQSVRGVSGVSQGVVISRINTDISVLEFEQSVTNMIRDIENKYWDLCLALQLYHSETQTFEDIAVYRNILVERDESGESTAQAENRLYEADARLKGSLGDVLKAENRLRRLMGLPPNDGTFLTPVDLPSEAKLIPDWESSLLESLSYRSELRRQKWEIRSLELQLAAAKNLVRPRLDFVSQYRVNGFGDNLTGEEDDDGLTDVGYGSAYESLTQGMNTTWNLGLSFSMPIGLRLARAQVRNYELRIRKAKAVLAAQEEELARELNEAILSMDQWYLLADSGAKRAVVAARYADTAAARLDSEEQRDPITIGRVLEAKITSRDADQGYLRSIIEYNKAITELNFRKGTLLQANSIYLAEGEWNPPAYEDARERGEAMTHALDNTHLETEPAEFVGGPGRNSWESQGSPNRPHVPGIVEGAAYLNSPGVISPASDVPPVPAEPSQEPALPMNPVPEIPADAAPASQETLFRGVDIDRDFKFDNTQELRSGSVSRAGHVRANKVDSNDDSPGRARLHSSD